MQITKIQWILLCWLQNIELQVGFWAEFVFDTYFKRSYIKYIDKISDILVDIYLYSFFKFFWYYISINPAYILPVCFYFHNWKSRLFLLTIRVSIPNFYSLQYAIFFFKFGQNVATIIFDDNFLSISNNCFCFWSVDQMSKDSNRCRNWHFIQRILQFLEGPNPAECIFREFLWFQKFAKIYWKLKYAAANAERTFWCEQRRGFLFQNIALYIIIKLIMKKCNLSL